MQQVNMKWKKKIKEGLDKVEINIRDTLVLDNQNEYVVVSKTNYNNIAYYYLIDINHPSNVKICYQDYGDLVDVVDRNLMQILMPIFLETSKKYLPTES